MGTLTSLAGETTYLDSNIIIYFVEANPEFSPFLVDLFHAIDRSQVKAVTSELTLAECLVKPFMDNNPARQQTYESMLITDANLQVIPVSRPILIAAAKLRPLHKLRLPDAIHLATAFHTACQTFITNDQLIKPIPGITILQLADFVK